MAPYPYLHLHAVQTSCICLLSAYACLVETSPQERPLLPWWSRSSPLEYIWSLRCDPRLGSKIVLHRGTLNSGKDNQIPHMNTGE